MRDPQEKGKAKKRKQQQQKQKGDKGFSGERAPRVDPNAPISVRKQIQLAHGLKKMHEASASNDNGGDRPVLNPADALKDAANQRRARSRKFRRSKDEAQAAFVARRSGGGDPDGTRWTIPKSNRGNRRSGGDDDGWRVLVDGYNVVGASREYAKARDLESMEAARAALKSDTMQLAAMFGWRIELIFDSYLTGRPSTSESIASGKQRGSRNGADDSMVTVTFTGKSESADAYIERTSYELSRGESSSRSSSGYVVVTDDRQIRDAVLSHGGGFPYSTQRFLDDLAQAKEEARYVAKAISGSSLGLSHKISTPSSPAIADSSGAPLSAFEKKRRQQQQQQQQKQRQGHGKCRGETTAQGSVTKNSSNNQRAVGGRFSNRPGDNLPPGFLEALERGIAQQEQQQRQNENENDGADRPK